MDDRTFEVGTTAAVFLLFVAVMAVAEATGSGRWGVLAALAVFVAAATGAGVAIARRAY